MGTRYMISAKDVEKLLAAGDADKLEDQQIYTKEWNKDEQTYMDKDLSVIIGRVGIAGWEFSSRIWDKYCDLTGNYVGPNIWKDEVDQVLEKHGIVADWC